MTTAKLRCRIYPGQFSSEFAVTVESFNGREFSLFASQDDVEYDQTPSQDEPSVGRLRVAILKHEGGNVLVQLPQSTIENGSYLAVRQDQLLSSHETACV